MDFLEPRRQHPLGVLILAAQFLWRFGQQAWPLLIGVSFGDNALRNILLGGTGFLVLTGAYALIYYLRFQYSVEGEVLVVQKGVIQRERLQVPFERIQTIQLFQGPIQQVFGLTLPIVSWWQCGGTSAGKVNQDRITNSTGTFSWPSIVTVTSPRTGRSGTRSSTAPTRST